MLIKNRYTLENNITENPKSLIIGTFPSVLIREYFKKLRIDDVNYFYGSRDNFFWPTLEKIFDKPLKYDWSKEAVDQRKHILKKHRIILTDVFASCRSNGGSTDNDLFNYELNEKIIDLLENNPTINTIFFTSGSGKINAESLALKIFRNKNKICDMRIIRKSNPRIRTFYFNSNKGSREIRAITLYSPSPLAKRGGVTEEKRIAQYRHFLKGHDLQN